VICDSGGWLGLLLGAALALDARQTGTVNEASGFGEIIRRLLGHRGLDAAALLRVDESSLQAALGGSPPTAVLLGQLVPTLGLRLPDLCVIGQVPVPEYLAPLDDRAGGAAASLVSAARGLSAQPIGRLLVLARAMPQQARTRPVPLPRSYEEYPPGFGGVLLRMLRNRNLGWASAAKSLYLLGGTQLLSASTVGMVGRGHKELTPRLLADFAAVLGVDAGDLAAMGAIRQAPAQLPVHPCATQLAELIWEARRLTYEQVRQLIDQAKYAVS
jgi:hypothetical protein